MGSREGRKNLTTKQLNMIKKLYRSTPAKQIAAKAKCSTGTVYQIGQRLGLSRDLSSKSCFKYRNGRAKFVKSKNGCWLWIASTTIDGYGIAHGKDTILAHRQMYIDHKGEIPSGLVLDHLCRNPACVNPDHLEPVPQYINCRRGDMAKLSFQQVEAIRKVNSKTIAELAADYGVSKGHIHDIKRGTKWQEKTTLQA